MRMEHLIHSAQAASIDLLVPGDRVRRRFDPSATDVAYVEREFPRLMPVELGVVGGRTLVPVCRDRDEAAEYLRFCRRCCVVSPRDVETGRALRQWTRGEDSDLAAMQAQGRTLEECARGLGRTVESVKSRIRTLRRRGEIVDAAVR